MCRVFLFFFFFFKQKTAYEIRLSLVGSEMCIRDRVTGVATDELLRHILLGDNVKPAGATGSVDGNAGAANVNEGSNVKAVQRVLADLGYAPGPVDGALGSTTTRAIIAFQHDRKIAETGRITPGLLTELKRVTG